MLARAPDTALPWLSSPWAAERRSLCREDDELVGMKCEYALSQGLKVCGCCKCRCAQ